MNAAPSPVSPPPEHLSKSDTDISPQSLEHELNLPNAKMVMKTNENHHRAYKSKTSAQSAKDTTPPEHPVSKALNTARRRQGTYTTLLVFLGGHTRSINPGSHLHELGFW